MLEVFYTRSRSIQNRAFRFLVARIVLVLLDNGVDTFKPKIGSVGRRRIHTCMAHHDRLVERKRIVN